MATEGQKEWLNTLDDDVVVMTYPINKAAFVQAIDIMVRMQCRIGSLTRRIHELTHSIEDKQLIDRAKRHLMQIHDIQEYEAHRQLQKLSMDSGQRMADVARIIFGAHLMSCAYMNGTQLKIYKYRSRERTYGCDILYGKLQFWEALFKSMYLNSLPP